jgi:hypothetical protein
LKIKRRQTDSLGMGAGHMIALVEANWKQSKIHMNLYYIRPHKNLFQISHMLDEVIHENPMLIDFKIIYNLIMLKRFMLVKVVDYYLEVVLKNDIEIMAYITTNKKVNHMKVNEVIIEEGGS